MDTDSDKLAGTVVVGNDDDVINPEVQQSGEGEVSFIALTCW